MQTHFWLDNWYNGRSLHDDWSSILPQSGLYARVNEVYTGNRWLWPIALLHIPAPDFHLDMNMADEFHWQFPNGNSFNFSSLYGHIRNKKEEVEWHDIVWFSGNTPRHSFILWLAIWDRLRTKYRILSWGHYVDTTCVLCHLACETREHLFFECVFVHRI